MTDELSKRYRGEAGKNYFAWQTEIGAAGAILNREKFTPFVEDDMCVVDFGCGGGFLLAALPANRRIGIDPNPSARAEAAARGIEVVASTDELGDGVADVVISNHALEHEDSGNRVARLTLGDVRSTLAARGFHIAAAERYGMYYRHDPGPAMRLLSLKPLFPLARFALAALNVVSGSFGNKLAVVAERTDAPAAGGIRAR